MASPFVPVDLDKLLDEFEENEETKPQQLVSSVASGTIDNKHLTKWTIQAPFPSIEEEVLSDQGSDQDISDDKTDSSSDNDSISGVIKEAEIITNQGLLSYKPQTTQGVVADENIIDELGENVVIADYARNKCLDGNTSNPLNDIEEILSGDLDVNEQIQLNQCGHAQLLDGELEAVNVSAGFCSSEQLKENAALSNVSLFTETNHSGFGVVTANSESFDECSISFTADHEGHHASEDRFDPVRSGVVGIGQNQVDSTVRPIEPEISNVPSAADGVVGIGQCKVDSTFRLAEPVASTVPSAADGVVGIGQCKVDSTVRPIEPEISNVPSAADGAVGIGQCKVDSTVRPIKPEISNVPSAADGGVGIGQNQADSTIRLAEPVTSNVPPAADGVVGIGQCKVDLTVRPIEPEISNVPLAANSECCFPGLNQALDSPGLLGELTDEPIPGLHGEQGTHYPGSGDDTCTYQDGHSSQQCADPETRQYNSCGSTDLSSEAASETSWMPAQNVSLSGGSHSQDYEHFSNVDSNPQPTMSSQDQLQTPQLHETSASGAGIVNNSAAHLMQANQAPEDTRDNQSEITSHSVISLQSEASTDYGQAYETIDSEAGTLPLAIDVDEQTQLLSEPDLMIAMQSQGILEAQRITAGEANLGKVPPIWVPDSVATHCMNCGIKFSVIKRRHHCRACGKALCSSCCNMKFLLPYMDNKEGRVCQVCCNALLRAQALLQVAENQTIGENLRGDNESPTEDLMFDDGLEEDEELPVDQEEFVETTEGVEDDDTTDFSAAEVDVTSGHSAPVLPPLELPVGPPPDTVGTPLSTPTSPALSDDSDCLFRLDVDNVRSLLPQDITALPPVLKIVNEEVSIQERPDPAEIMYLLKGLHETVVFLLNKNLVVKVSIVKLSCCVKRKCWCFVTEGMGAANQEEMVVLLECLRKETMLPKDVLSHFNTAFAYAKQGHTVSELGYTIFGQPFLGSSDNAGFLYVKPTYQCVKNLPLPSTPYVVGILIKRPETPWAQLFPLRLQLRLGAEYRYYPCPLFSSRNRSAVYGEVGHTIMNLLADFKNFQYTLARVTGLVIHMEEKKTLVRLPQDRYDEVVKILNATDEHVMALGANFSLQADSHLVCIQNEQGYKTQAINIQNQTRKVTGASFVVFSGALKTSSPFMAKVNIVEDGIMVQLMPEVIVKLRNSLKEMKDYTITTGIPGGGGEEHVIIEWVSRKDAPHQSSLCSPIDGLQLHGFPSVKVHTGCDFTRKSVFRIQWTEMFFLGDGQQSASRDTNKLTAELAKAFCRTLMPHLSKLCSDDCTCIGLRVNLDNDNVGYFTGSNQQGLPSSIMSDLDDVLVPVLHSAASHHRRRALSVELLFKVLRL